MATFTIPVLLEQDMHAAGGTVGSNGTYATNGSTFTYSASDMPTYSVTITDNGADQTTLSADTDGVNSDGGANTDNEGADGETATVRDPNGNVVGTPDGRVAADRSAVLEGSDGSTITIYEIEVFDDLDMYAFSAPLQEGVTYTVVSTNTRDQPIQYSEMVCLARGTPIATQNGERPVQTLRTGCKVTVLDGPPATLVLAVQDTYRPGRDAVPVRIGAGALGNARDLIVSAQHRVLWDGGLVAAGLLADELGGQFRRATGLRATTFHNLLLDRHHVIFAGGAPVESLYPGPRALCRLALGRGTLLTARLRWPGLWEAASHAEVRRIYGPPARPILRRSDLRAMALA
ncbi:Hint domain-containing protein [Jannaschia aquimarina]|uniref:Hedgehog/Intein (Hint) domain-containing protein n=1 Tax=Jannaschia aquimarina TaxID=935700 RepID=A0A0D1CPL5_9RHOB|nr:Hint domain-containing protein [Jannaschia aquimarina]KIT16702.1 hypothetical protein jaqu_14900 [Jannaschia aquimarina]SNS54699.1 Hint domain-containing protein [Jannaschia aquimarina]